MMRKYLQGVAGRASALACLLAASTAAPAQWQPAPNWTDSYAVDGVCYCSSGNFDHGLDTKQADTPIGRLDVTQICADIRSTLGVGRSAGRVPYNDIQCGNGPANDAPDEAGCPGRVDIGSSGCSMIGPRWNLEAVYGAASDPVAPLPGPDDASGPSAQDQADIPSARAAWRVDATHNAANAEWAIDGDPSTRWSTETRQHIGQRFKLDLGSVQRIAGLRLGNAIWPEDFPRRYVVWMSLGGERWTALRSGRATSEGLTLAFDPIDTRHLRIDQIGNDPHYWWSIGELDVVPAP